MRCTFLSAFRKSAWRRVLGSPPARRRVSRRCVEPLEDRTLLATISVTNVNDAGAGSLRQAILDANNEVARPGSDTIVFSGAAAGKTITLTTMGGTQYGPNALEITSTILIDGNGETIARGAGAPNFRLFHVAPAANLTLLDVTLTNGLARGGNGGTNLGDDGGGGGGGLGAGGALFNQGTVTLTRTTFTGNTAQGGNGGAGANNTGTDAGGGGGGGGIGGNGGATPNNGTNGGAGGGGFFGSGVGGASNFGGGGGGTLNDGVGAAGGVANGGAGGAANVNGTLGGFGGGGGGGGEEAPGGAGGEGGGGGGSGEDDGVDSANPGGAGGFGGGGGGGGEDNNGGLGGFGGGGGGSSRDGTTLLAVGGAGGFNAGAGGSPFAVSGSGGGGGGAGSGGAIFNYGGSITVSNSTFLANSAIGGYGVGGTTPAMRGSNGLGNAGGILNRNGTLTIRSSTFTNNNCNGSQDGPGRGIFNIGDGGTATVTLHNSILGQYNTNVTDYDGVAINGGAVVSSGTGNLIRVNNGFAGTIVSTADPLIVRLAKDGATTSIYLPLPGSPAINAGTNAEAAGLATDQRGVTRILGSIVDIGATEAPVNTTTAINYVDVDGDNVTVTLSKPLLTPANVGTIFQFRLGTSQLKSIDLTSLGVAANGVGLTTKAVRSPLNGGDGFAALGEINATGIDLGNVTIDGDLGRILAGDATTTTQGVGAIGVHSMGRFGLATGATDLNSTIIGKLVSLKSKTDIKEANIAVQGGIEGKIGSVTIGGSLIGGTELFAGRIFSAGDMGAVIVTGDVVGGALHSSGRVESGAKLASVTIGGSLIGGADFCGGIYSNLDMGAVKITGDVVGGYGNSSGSIKSFAKLTSVTIGGSLIGRSAEYSGQISSAGDLGAVLITGDVVGGSGYSSGQVVSGAKLASVTIGRSLVGGEGSTSGAIFVVGELTTLSIIGSIRGGSASGAVGLGRSGYVQAGRIGTLTLGGSLIAGTNTTAVTFYDNGAIRVHHDIASLTIKGSILGNRTHRALITARGQVAPVGTTDLAIGKLTVNGRVEFGSILAGSGLFFGQDNADAQIGPVVIGHDWIASDLVAGAYAGGDGRYGTGDDTKLFTIDLFFVKDVVTVFSKIVSCVIGGQVIGTATPDDHFGFVAENIGSFKVKGETTTFPLFAGNSNDDLLLTILFGDLRLNEI